MLEEYIYRGRQRLRCGYTTGSCAAAAAKAAAQMLFTGQQIRHVELMTPKGIMLELQPQDCQLGKEHASCAIQKDSGDDPDITKGIFVYARVNRIPAGIIIDGGSGIGRVTKPGLDQPVGAAAINSVPRSMIEAAVREIMEEYEYREGLFIEISIPGGEELARKTFNPRLGIEGGLSILGTSGIVEPMSNEALLETIRIEARVKRESGKEYLFLTLGNYGQNYVAKNIPNLMDQSVKCSNFIGEGIDIGLELGYRGILLVGHIGKLVKLGAGIMNTHSAQADGRMEVLATCGLLAGVEPDILKKIPECVTVDDALMLLQQSNDLEQTMEILMKRIQYHLEARVKKEVPIGAIVFSNRFGLLGRTQTAPGLLEKVLEENRQDLDKVEEEYD